MWFKIALTLETWGRILFKKKKPVFTLLLFFYCGTTVYCESMAASLGPPFRTRAWAGLQIIRSLLSVSLSLFFITIYMIITLSMVPLSQKRLDFLFFPLSNIQMIHCLTLKCTYGVGIKNPWENLSKWKAMAETVHWHMISQHAKCNECDKKGMLLGPL